MHSHTHRPPKNVNPKQNVNPERRQKRKNRIDTNKKYKIMVVHLNPNISITTLSINAINAPVKRNIMQYFFNPVMLRRNKSLK